LLDRKIAGLPWREWSIPILQLTLNSAIAGLICWATRWGLESVLGTEGLLYQLVALSLAGLVGLGVFALLTSRMNLPEVEQLMTRLRQRFRR
jgi:putative peptidoglycan lipid II flippase